MCFQMDLVIFTKHRNQPTSVAVGTKCLCLIFQSSSCVHEKLNAEENRKQRDLCKRGQEVAFVLLNLQFL